MGTSWREIVGIEHIDLAALARRRESSTFGLLVAALIEAGTPLTLAEVATRLAAIGWGAEADALLSLQRCRPARRPVFRLGDKYALDPHDPSMEEWKWRNGFEEFVPVPRVAPPPPVAGLEVPLTFSELDEAWRNAGISGWSAQRLAMAVLDAAGGPLPPERVLAEVERRTRAHALHHRGDANFRKKGSAVLVLDDGRWALAEGMEHAVRATRRAVRQRVAMSRKWAGRRLDPLEVEKRGRAIDRQDEQRRLDLEALRRVIVVAYPPDDPVAVAVVQVAERQVETFFADRFDALRAVLSEAEVVAGLDTRALLTTIQFDPDDRRVHDLREIQKTYKLDQRGKTLKITTELVISGTCGISKPFGEAGALERYADGREWNKLARRLEADAKVLHALYEYGRLHGCVRLLWGFLDDRLPAPWVERVERGLYPLLKAAEALRAPLEVVLGSAPGWEDPWSRAQQVWVQRAQVGWALWDERGDPVEEDDIQLARLIEPNADEWN